jgi:hypothetical protein
VIEASGLPVAEDDLKRYVAETAYQLLEYESQVAEVLRMATTVT